MEHYEITTDRRKFSVFANDPDHLRLILQQALAPGEVVTTRRYTGNVPTITRSEMQAAERYRSLTWIGADYCQIQYENRDPVYIYKVICDPNF